MEREKKTFEFSISYKVRKFFKEETITKTYQIEPPTLGVLDLIVSKCQFEIDDTMLKSEGFEIIVEGRRLIRKYAKKFAMAVAIAVIGENCFFMRNRKMCVNNREINKLARILYCSLKPSELKEISESITANSDIGNFITSIRMMTAI